MDHDHGHMSPTVTSSPALINPSEATPIAILRTTTSALFGMLQSQSTTPSSLDPSLPTAGAGASTHAGSHNMGSHSDSEKCAPTHMTWNWETIDSCFITEQWHVQSAAGFAGSCLAALALAVLMQALRRASSEYDHRITSNFKLRTRERLLDEYSLAAIKLGDVGLKAKRRASGRENTSFRPSLMQQMVRALLHTAQFTVGYFLML